MTQKFAFIMDQQVGLRTQSLNFKTVVEEDPAIQAQWLSVHYKRPAGLLTRLPGVPKSISGTLCGIGEIRAGWKQMAGGCEAALWATWAAKSVPELVRTAPAFLVMDMTPVQMEAMGALYGYGRARARLGSAWKRRATERLYREAQHLFPWNQWVAASLRDDYGVPPEKITPVFPGVDLSLFHPDSSVYPADGVTRLLFVGGDFERKGGDLLLRWARETRVAVLWELHLVTRDPVPETRNVRVHHGITNNSAELVRLYQQSDLFVLPTRADCFSFVAMEAMACGLPVAISDLGGIPELIVEKVTGKLLTQDSYEGLAETLDYWVGAPTMRRAMGAAALAHAQTHFDCRVNIRKILDAMKVTAPSDQEVHR